MSEDDQIQNEIETAAGLMKAKEADDASDAAASGGRRQRKRLLEHHEETPQDAIRPARYENGVTLGDYQTTREAAAHNLGEGANAAAGATKGMSETRGRHDKRDRIRRIFNEVITSEDDCTLRKRGEEMTGIAKRERSTAERQVSKQMSDGRGVSGDQERSKSRDIDYSEECARISCANNNISAPGDNWDQEPNQGRLGVVLQ